MIINMKIVRCAGCNTVLFSQGISKGVVEIKCRKSQCRTINHIEFDGGIVRITKTTEYLAERSYVMLK